MPLLLGGTIRLSDPAKVRRMPVSPHLRRRLRETLGADAGDDLVDLLDVLQATRGDIAELRHEMQLRFEKLDARISAVDAKFPVLEAKFEGQTNALGAR